jgi:hypothetical protein
VDVGLRGMWRLYSDFCKHCDRHESEHPKGWCLVYANRFTPLRHE